MRSRSGSGVRLDRILFLAEQTIMKHQDPVTALFANQSENFPDHAWVRDNVYAAHALWALYRAFQKSADFDEDRVKANELGMTCVKLMQSLLECMMRQSEKVEEFKKHQRALDALHAKYSARKKLTVTADSEWGHLQLDATSLFLLTLAQMTASGLQVVRNFDEVAFIQNLVWYIETGYRTPDFGVWERGDKTNQGIRELNASSIGMVKAALQALNSVGDLFGDGSKGSVIHVMPDEIEQCTAVLESMLPRESFSKETDAALLTIISYPGFAVEDSELIEATRETIIASLYGKYGCKRFLRDGYKTVLEDGSRLYYNKSELQQFEDIECEWPVFICFLLLDAMYRKDESDVERYWRQLDELLVVCPAGFRYVPELYKVERDCVSGEKANRGSQPRAYDGPTPYLWAQSLYVICCLLYEGFLLPSELDPLSRRMAAIERKAPCEVQVSVLADSVEVQEELRLIGIHVQRVDELDDVFSVRPASALAATLAKLGECSKLSMTGRPLERDVGILSTSRLYQVGKKFVIFTPQFMDRSRSHLMYDIRILMDEWGSELTYLYDAWRPRVQIAAGRALVVLVVNKGMLSSDGLSSIANLSMTRFMKSTVTGTIKKISNGYIGGARVVMKNVSDFFRTTAVNKLEFHDDWDETRSGERIQLLAREDKRNEKASMDTPKGQKGAKGGMKRGESVKDRSAYNAVHKASMRHRSIVLDSNDSGKSKQLSDENLVQLRLAYTRGGKASLDPTNGAPTTPEKSGRQVTISSSPTIRSSPISIPISSPSSSALPVLHESPLQRSGVLHTNLRATGSASSLSDMSGSVRLEHSQLEEMGVGDVVEMLRETSDLEEQTTLVHYLWMKFGADYDTRLEEWRAVTVRELMEEVYEKACESREWSLIRLTSGLLRKRLDELPKAVTHLLVRQKQLTVGMPSKKEEAITCPKTNEELKDIMYRAYADDPNAFTLSQEIIVYLGSLVRTEPKLFTEVFRLRVGLIIQVLASELARLRNLSAADALQNLLTISPFEMKSMLFLLLSGRLLEDASEGGEGKGARTGIGSFRKQIEERKSMRKSMRAEKKEDRDSNESGSSSKSLEESGEESEESGESEEEVFGIWLRHRRIDGALNRVPPNFYATLWDTLHRFPQGVRVNGITLHWGLTQEMTRREIKFALEVEEVLNQIPEPEYRELVIETIYLVGRLEKLTTEYSSIPSDRPIDIDTIIQRANAIFVEQNRQMETEVLDCCATGESCDGARGICKHLYDSAPAGEYGTSHYIIKSLCSFFMH
ncbi:hypothetical protein PFISCL1PPCAC_9939 [Pristionchus fissidentatus]|uniref:Phosphorylase b kinase regulatory subunit n=1 Tax=Pristionchus fissidentatus TaxID=1538716 RepID=A0AAV5VKN2_9BILA|nr:hypothetical protein PFISCL1PPCAC_9939 [Pristionchus fissidentatus]